MEPRLGANTEELTGLYRNGMVPYGPAFDTITTTLRRFIQQVPIHFFIDSVVGGAVARGLLTHCRGSEYPLPALPPSPPLLPTHHACLSLPPLPSSTTITSLPITQSP